jgi:hypothetical protein
MVGQLQMAQLLSQYLFLFPWIFVSTVAVTAPHGIESFPQRVVRRISASTVILTQRFLTTTVSFCFLYLCRSYNSFISHHQENNIPFVRLHPMLGKEIIEAQQ